MNRSMCRFICSMFLCMSLNHDAFAQSHACARVQPDAQRLECYDSAYGKPVMQGTETRAAASTTVAPAPVGAGSNRARALETPAAPVIAAAPAAEAPARIESSVETLRRLLDGRFEVRLKNGEVWSQLEAERKVELAVGDAVVIRRAMLGSTMLVTPDGLSTRVRRVP